MFGDKIQKKENLPYRWVTHWKWATMVAKIRPVRVTHSGWCCARFTRRFFKACAIARFRNQFARGQKTIGSHFKYFDYKLLQWFLRFRPTCTRLFVHLRFLKAALILILRATNLNPVIIIEFKEFLEYGVTNVVTSWHRVMNVVTILTGAISYKRPKSFGDSRIKIPTRS